MPQDLSVEFGNIIETPTIFPEEQGQLEITITNAGDEDATNATLELFASTDTVLDSGNLNSNSDTRDDPTIPEGLEINALQGTDESLGSIQRVNLAAGESETFTIDFTTEDFRTTSVVSPGAYNLIAEVKADADEDADGSNHSATATQFISSDNTDVVLDWNSVFLNAVQAEGKDEFEQKLPQDSTSIEDIPGVAPPIEARNAAILHLAVYDSVYAFSENPRSSDLAELPETPEEASQEAAAVGAAYTVSSTLFPEQQATFDAQRDRSLAEIDDAPAAEQAGFDFGAEVAQAILAERNNDGASQAQVPYTPGTAAGDYQEVREDGPVTALLPNWGRVTPFAINSTVSFRPEGPPAFSSVSYAEDINQVRDLGGLVDTDLTPVGRDGDETQIAEFWSYDRPDTFRPPGQWNQITQEVAIDRGNTLEENAQLFAELNVAMADAGIVAWDGKYAYEQLRPVTAIRNGDSDNNPNTTADPDWEPLIDTPNFPDYISGHSAFGGAAAGILEDNFGEDVSFKIASQELPGVSREFTSLGSTSSFELAARENADSRLFGGVHVDISNVDGVEVGLNVANSVSESDLFV